MTALGKVIRTTAFKLSVIYIAVFSVFSVALALYISYAADQLLGERLNATIASELYGLAGEYRLRGLPGVVRVIDRRSREPGASLYLITDVSGRVLAGNVAQVPASLLNSSGAQPLKIPYQRYSGDTSEHVAVVQVVRLPGGFRMLVGRDLGEREEFSRIIVRALAWALVLMFGLALLSWFFVSRRVLKRIDSLSATSRKIMVGDLSGRLEITGSGDEFDRLAENLNAMLDRIEHLMLGLKNVSDNIAHDLKTPLTRMRNRVEAALASPQDPASYRAVLEATIEESDHLIKTFNALLLIARMEAGSQDGAMAEVEIGGVLRDVVELYEPLAEEKGVVLSYSAGDRLTLTANRELLSLALANLVDNALKYAASPGGQAGGKAGDGRIGIAASRDGDDIVLTVTDSGAGIPPADRERVLQRFVRLEESRSQPGSGLGLSLVAAVVNLHHGRIELGDANPGLIVTLRLPLSRPKQ